MSYLDGMSSQQAAEAAAPRDAPDGVPGGVPDGVPDGVVVRVMPRTVVVMLGVIGGVVLVLGLKGAAGIVAPSLLALVLTIAVLPVEAWARRHHWPQWLATLFALVMAYLILLVLLVGTVV